MSQIEGKIVKILVLASPSEKISKVMMEKNLRLIEDKCVVITIGTKKQREETKIQLRTNPIMWKI